MLRKINEKLSDHPRENEKNTLYLMCAFFSEINTTTTVLLLHCTCMSGSGSCKQTFQCRKKLMCPYIGTYIANMYQWGSGLYNLLSTAEL